MGKGETRRTYQVKLKGDPVICEFLAPHVQKEYEALRRARAKSRAVRELFGDQVNVDIISKPMRTPVAHLVRA